MSACLVGPRALPLGNPPVLNFINMRFQSRKSVGLDSEEEWWLERFAAVQVVEVRGGLEMDKITSV